MALNKEEIAADLVWRCTEHVRALESEGKRVEFTREELEQLVGTLELATRVPQALAVGQPPECRAAVRRRVEQSYHETPPLQESAAGVALPHRPAARSMVPAWQFRLTAAAALAMGAALVSVNAWHPQRTEVRTVMKRVPVQAPDVDPIDEREVHALLPRMVRAELPPRQEKNLMWHMIVCSGCFDEYVQLKHQEKDSQLSSRSAVRLVGW